MIADGLIPDSAGLLRRIHPTQVVPDQNRGGLRPSTAAFKAPQMSVDVEEFLHEQGLDFNFSLRGYNGYSLVRIRAKFCSDAGLEVVHKRITGNDAHAEVIGKKRDGLTSSMSQAAEWVYLRP
jgi:hypothetical protein